MHLMEVFSQIGLSKDDSISVFEAIVEMADVCKEVDPEVTPYKIDKIMWLICSGRFTWTAYPSEGTKTIS